MAWIELHQSLWTHKKTYRLAAKLGIDETQAGGHLARFWSWALDNAADGALSYEDSDVIAMGAGWRGDADFVAEMVAAGWLDDTGEGYFIHDWHTYAGRLLEKRAANAQRARTVRERSANVAPLPTNQPTVPTKPTVPNQPTEPAGAGLKEIEAEWFSKTGQTATPFLFEQFEEAMKRWGTEATLEAIAETGKQNARSWKYTKAILERWASQGRDSPRGDAASKYDTDINRRLMELQKRPDSALSRLGRKAQ